MASAADLTIARIFFVYSSPTELVVGWNTPVAPATRFHVQYCPRYLGRWQEWDDTYRVPVAAITELTPGNRYSVRVRAFHATVGWGEWTVSDLDLWTTNDDGELPRPRGPNSAYVAAVTARTCGSSSR